MMDAKPVNTDLSRDMCGECGGIVRHTRTCSAFDAARVLLAHGGGCQCFPDRDPADAAALADARDTIIEAFGFADVEDRR